MRMVTEFHEKHDFPVGNLAAGEDPKTDLIRVHLIAEELGELALALAERDEAGVADALADLAYVTVGAAVAYGLPLAEVFSEVHRSNMTKAVRDPSDSRLRSKGESYQPADVAGTIERASERKRRPVRRRYFDARVLLFAQESSDRYTRSLKEKAARDGTLVVEIRNAGPRGREWAELLVSGSYTARGNGPSDVRRILHSPIVRVGPDGRQDQYRIEVVSLSCDRCVTIPEEEEDR
jgi:predicted HAD superfamily Cof-like phosphohydrolase